MSWFERAFGHRRYFDAQADEMRGDGLRLVHTWVQLLCGATVEWGARWYVELDEAMQRGQHDGGSGWGMFRNDVTRWLAAVAAHATADQRRFLVPVAACCERYLTALGGPHAETSAPLCARWKAALEANATLDLDEVRRTPELGTLGAGGVLALIEASFGIAPAATPPLPTRSGEPARTPLELRVWPRDGGERSVRFDGGELAIGRAADADIRFDDPYVARAHARIVVEDDRVVIVDRRSDNQTFIFGTPIDRDELQRGDVIVVGRNVLFVHAS